MKGAHSHLLITVQLQLQLQLQYLAQPTSQATHKEGKGNINVFDQAGAVRWTSAAVALVEGHAADEGILMQFGSLEGGGGTGRR